MIDVDDELPPALRDAWRGAAPAACAGHRGPACDLVIAEIDRLLGDVTDATLHHPAFQRLEASWRGLAFLVGEIPFQENIELSMWNVSKADLERDFEESTEIVRTRTFFHAYSSEIGKYGGKPFAAILADMEFDTSPRDVRLLRQMAIVATLAHAPFFAAASARFLQIPSTADLPRLQDVKGLFAGAATLEWSRFRESDESRAVGLLVGKPLHRAPHDGAVSFSYVERAAANDDLLWGHPMYVFAVRLARSFARSGTLSAIVGDADACRAPATVNFGSLGPRFPKPPLEATITPRLERRLRDVGLIGLIHRVEAPEIYLASANSVQTPKSFGSTSGGREATLSHMLGTKFPYFFFACRIAHYLKLIERELIGQSRTRETIEARLNDWLGRFVSHTNAASIELRAKYPLRHARATVTESSEGPDWYEAEVLLRPHVKYLNSALNLVISDRVRR